MSDLVKFFNLHIFRELWLHFKQLINLKHKNVLGHKNMCLGFFSMASKLRLISTGLEQVLSHTKKSCIGKTNYN